MAAYSAYTDQELTVLLKEGSRMAYTEIYERYKTLLYQHAYKKLGDADEAQDILQDTFLTLWQRKDDVDAEANLSGYLYTSMRNKILNVFAHKKVRTRYEDSLQQFSENSDVTSDHLVREHQMNELIEREINALPEKMRQIFLLSRRQHLKNKEIADMLGLSEHTVATQLKRALKHLRLRLGLVLYLAMLLQPKLPHREDKIQNNLPPVYPKVLH